MTRPANSCYQNISPIMISKILLTLLFYSFQKKFSKHSLIQLKPVYQDEQNRFPKKTHKVM